MKFLKQNQQQPPEAKSAQTAVRGNEIRFLLISLLVHLAAFFFFVPKLALQGVPQRQTPPLQISLGPPIDKTPQTAEIAAAPPMTQPPIAPKPAPKPTKKLEQKPAKPSNQPIIAADKPSDTTIFQPEKTPEKQPKTVEKKEQPTPENSPQEFDTPQPGEDMQAFIQRQKAQKLAKAGYGKRDIEEVLAGSQPQNTGDKRDAKIKENLNFNGTNGIFQIRELGLNNAQFSFKGWKNNVDSARLEIIDVRANDGTDIKQVVIRRMIAIIRREYSGDFHWQSQRLNQVLTLSARPEDNEALESFMMQEFFSGAQYR